MPLFFLPGAAGSASFWKPVADRLTSDNDTHFFNWPGLGNEASQIDVTSIDDLVGLVLAKLSRPTTLIAQSMGGYIALRVALERPDLVERLVLTVSSVGVTSDTLGAINWRTNYAENWPNAATFITAPTLDLTPRFKEISIRCLLLWAGNDPISPVKVAQYLNQRLVNSSLVVFENADHNLAITHVEEVAKLIADFIT